MDDDVDVALHGQETVDELRLVTELMVVAATAPSELEQAVIDDALGLEHARRRFPSQRRAD